VQRVRRSKAKADASDPQRDSVYRWEASHETWNVCTLTLADCQALADEALAGERCKPVKVIQGPSNRYSWNVPAMRTISMQGPSRRGRGGMNYATVLHECAHQIGFDKYGAKIQDHGPVFMAYYRKLLLKYRVMDEKEFSLTSRYFQLKWHRAL
jgi:hypothetical protein